eukprot:1237290-Ditylum_brightwellii.AAC.1
MGIGNMPCLGWNDVFGYIVDFTPDGRTADKSQQQEYKTVQSAGKIEIMILHAVSIISHLCDKQKSRNASLKSIRSMVKERNEDTPMEKFVLLAHPVSEKDGLPKISVP